MRCIVCSDTHGDGWTLRRVVERHLADADFFFHLGDGADELDEVRRAYPNKRFLSVRGNCDFASEKPPEGLITLQNVRIFYTHGHIYNVKYGLYDFIAAARRHRAQIALYGHTHVAYTGYEDGLYLMNPGSLARPAYGDAGYGVIDLSEKSGIAVHLVSLSR